MRHRAQRRCGGDPLRPYVLRHVEVPLCHDAPFAPRGPRAHRNTIAAVKALDLPETEREQIFFGNARKLMRM